MEKRVTKKERYTELLDIVTELNRTELVEFVEHELELLNKRASHNTLTKTQKENLELVEVIYNALVELAKPVTISELIESNDAISQLSNQKVSALTKKLVDSERVVKVTEKGKSYFSVK
jgi:hypothetical protein